MSVRDPVPGAGGGAAWRAHTGGLAWPTLALLAVVVCGEAATVALVLGDALPLWGGTLVNSVLAYLAFTVMHEASHNNIHGGHPSLKALDTVAGWVAAIPLLAPYPAFKVLHLTHHSHTNVPGKDPDLWVVGGSVPSVVARCLTIIVHHYGQFLSGYTSRTHAAVNARLSALVAVALYVVAMVALVATGHGTLLVALWVVPAFLGAGLLAFAFDWLPHHPHSATGRYRDTRILLAPGATLLLLGQNYHLVHHLWPRVPFFRYGRCFRDARTELEQRGAIIEGIGGSLDLPAPLSTPMGGDL